VGCKNTRKGFWSQDEKFGKLGSKVWMQGLSLD
jgi:hypothetical protein